MRDLTDQDRVLFGREEKSQSHSYSSWRITGLFWGTNTVSVAYQKGKGRLYTP